MTGQDLDGDFTACHTAMPNRFFTSWVTTHGQAALNTRQRNLRHLFTWLEEAYGHPHPYTAALHRHPPKRPSTLGRVSEVPGRSFGGGAMGGGLSLAWRRWAAGIGAGQWKVCIFCGGSGMFCTQIPAPSLNPAAAAATEAVSQARTRRPRTTNF